MKSTALYLILSVLTGDAAAFAAEAPAVKPASPKPACDCPMHKKAGAMCPDMMKGVRTASKNIGNGVEITLAAGTRAGVAKLQKQAAAHYGGGCKCPRCPSAVAGAETRTENTPDGVKVTITAKTPEAVKQIQEASAKERVKAPAEKEVRKDAKPSVKYVCPMGCAGVISDKPGKCPKCGMPLEEKKQ